MCIFDVFRRPSAHTYLCLPTIYVTSSYADLILNIGISQIRFTSGLVNGRINGMINGKINGRIDGRINGEKMIDKWQIYLASNWSGD